MDLITSISHELLPRYQGSLRGYKGRANGSLWVDSQPMMVLLPLPASSCLPYLMLPGRAQRLKEVHENNWQVELLRTPCSSPLAAV